MFQLDSVVELWLHVIMNEKIEIEHASTHVGQPLRVLLEAIPGTGAIWYLPKTPAHAIVERAESEAMSESVGGAARQVFVFQADADGMYELDFELKRSWEPVVRRRKRVVVRVVSSAPPRSGQG